MGGRKNLQVLHKRSLLLPWVEAGHGAKMPMAASSKSAVGFKAKKAEGEKIWRELFSDLVEWRDYRSDKANPSFPDFRHKHSRKGLSLTSKCIPSWAEAKLAALPPNVIQLSTFSWNQKLSRCAQTGQYEKTLELFQQMQREGNADKFTFVPVLKACANLDALEVGRSAHEEIIRRGFESDKIVGTCLVDMYAKCGIIEEAARLFKQMPTRDVVTFNAMIGGYVKCGEAQKALELFEQMQVHGMDPDRVTFIGVLNACASVAALEVGRCAHGEITRRGYESDVVIGNCLVDMYAKCGRIEEAERVFNNMPTRNVVTLTAMLGGYVKCGEGRKALELFEQMHEQGVDPDRVTFVGVLNACASLAALEVGRRAHEEIIRRGYESDLVVGNCLVDMYAKCGSIEEAENLFKQMPKRDVITWTAMIDAYVKCGEGQKSLELFEQMKGLGVDPGPGTFVGVLNACASVAALDVGKRAHEEIIRRGYESDVAVGTCLVDMYAKCGRIEEAERLFKQMPTRDVVSLNVMIGGYVKSGEGQKALELFERMQGWGVVDPNPVTFVGVLNACASVGALEVGRHAHEEIIRRGYESDVVVGTCLIDMYAKCGSIDEAEKFFNQMPTRDVITFNAMISGYVKCREEQKALDLFEQMKGLGVDPGPGTFAGVLNACASIAALDVGKRAHEDIIRRGYELDAAVGTCLVDMYAKCGNIGQAEMLFRKMATRDVITWTAMIDGYVKCGEGQKALKLFEQMQGQGVDPNRVTFVMVLNACANIAALEVGRRAHEQIICKGYELDLVVGNCLIDMYAKCGSIEDAEKVFNQMPRRDVVAWNALLAGYGFHGFTRKALETFNEMCKVVEVDDVTFLSLLSACSHGGLIAEGLEYFKSMSAVFNITPTVEHFACVVDLLGRAGRLDEAEDLIMSMPMDPNATAWTALLSACRTFVNVEVGERCAKRVLELDPDNAAAYVLLSNIHVAAGKFDSMQIFNGARFV